MWLFMPFPAMCRFNVTLTLPLQGSVPSGLNKTTSQSSTETENYVMVKMHENETFWDLKMEPHPTGAENTITRARKAVML